MGVRGAHVTIGKTGTRTTVGLPGSGLSFTHLDKQRREVIVSTGVIRTHRTGVKVTHLGARMAALQRLPMLTQEQAVEIRVMARRGERLRAIAPQVGCSRNTVRRYLRDEEARRYSAREPRPCKLDEYKGYLDARIAQARPRWIPATVLLRETREQGYNGGITQLRDWLLPMKQGEPDPVVRFETPPGQQMQADTLRRDANGQTAADFLEKITSKGSDLHPPTAPRGERYALSREEYAGTHRISRLLIERTIPAICIGLRRFCNVIAPSRGRIIRIQCRQVRISSATDKEACNWSERACDQAAPHQRTPCNHRIHVHGPLWQ
jgi:transposase